ncbi:hypothetical protein EDC94DRAFT_579489 [Helicostylum pulchrum]|nr:hypothetical protein EDC94DRAFT_579489 [Helicostylum pulchrum]
MVSRVFVDGDNDVISGHQGKLSFGPNNCKVLYEEGTVVNPSDELMSLMSNSNAHRLQRRMLSKDGNALNNDVQQYYKSDAASGFSLLSTIAEDLKSLEDGVVMFSAEDNEYVLVVAPVLWIEADYPCHSGLWCSWSNHFVSLSKILYAHY